ncbi:hypothetical protein MRX96_023529 [Rhipicephalus microplus]
MWREREDVRARSCSIEESADSRGALQRRSSQAPLYRCCEESGNGQRVRGTASPFSALLRSSDAALAHPGGCWDSVAISPRLGPAPDIPLTPGATALLARYTCRHELTDGRGCWPLLSPAAFPASLRLRASAASSKVSGAEKKPLAIAASLGWSAARGWFRSMQDHALERLSGEARGDSVEVVAAGFLARAVSVDRPLRCRRVHLLKRELLNGPTKAVVK